MLTFNDNLEIGTTGSEIKLYLDNGSDLVYTTNDANISNNTWHHLSVTYGEGLNVYLDGSPAYISGWATSHLTGDSDSGISNTHTYTCAVNVNGATKTVNGVPFTGTNATSGTNWSITSGFNLTHNSNTSTVTGQIGDILGNGFRFNGDPQKIKITGLTPGENYTFALYSQSWGGGERNCTLSSSALAQTIMVNQDQFNSSGQDGLLVECSYCAPGTEVEFTIDPVVGSTTWHLYAFSNREGKSELITNTTAFATSGPLDSSSDSPVSLGLSRPYSDQTGDFNGSIDELRIFSRELNSSEVATLYNGGNGDFNGSTQTKQETGNILAWNDFSGSERHAISPSYVTSPSRVVDFQTGKTMVSLGFGKTLQIGGAVSMPMTVVMVGREKGSLFANRELFTNQGWRLVNNGNWVLRRWDDNNPNIASSAPSNLLTMVGWTFDRYGYELRINGTTAGTSTSNNWHPDVFFDRINSESSLLIGDLFLLPRPLEVNEREKLEGYFSHKWNLNELLPSGHPYLGEPPVGGEGLVLSGTPQLAGSFTVNINASNQWGSVDRNFTLEVNATAPQIQTQSALQVGSSSARLQGDLLENGGEAVQISFEYGTDLANLDQNSTQFAVSNKGIASQLLTGLTPGTTYFYRAWAANTAGTSNGNSISKLPLFDWPLQGITGSTITDLTGRAMGTVGGNAVAFVDPSRGNTVRFDGQDDYITFGDLDEMDSPNQFTLSLWFKKEQDITGQPTNHGIDNVLVAQSSSASNDNFEIGTQGSMVEVYIDSGLDGDLDTAVSVEAGISLNNWTHLALVYGSEMSLFINGVKITTWTQYNGKLDSSVTSPLCLGIARPNSNLWGEFKGLMQDVKIYDSELSPIEIAILAELGSFQSFTTGTQSAPPLVEVRPASNITESNATIHYELLSYDEAQPEIIIYWGPVDQGENEGLWENNQSLGQQGIGEGNVTISGFLPGDMIYYRARAKGPTYGDWSDQFGQLRMVDKPSVSILSANQLTLTSATLRGRVDGNGGVSQTVLLSEPKVSKDLIAHWRFDEGSGQEAYDSTGFTPAAQLFDGVSWVEGMGGQWKKALRFDGSSLAYLKAGSFRIEGDMSFSGWAYKENLGIYQGVFDFGNGTDDQNLFFSNRWKTSEAEWTIRRGANTRSLYATNFWTLNEWQHVVATVNEAGVMKLYRNGELKGSTLGHLPASTTRSNHYVGRNSRTDSEYFYGMMDDLRVYDRAISPEEVSQVYTGDLQVYSVLGGQNPTVTIYWGDEDAGQTIDVNSSSSSSWDGSVNLGVLPTGEFSTPLSGLAGGNTYFYRVTARNAAGSTVLSEVSSFSTGSFGFKSDSFAQGQLLLWLDSTDINGDGNLSNEPFGGRVDKWRDKSGANRHAGNGNGPELRINSWNSLTTLKFDGQSNYLRVSDSNAFNLGEDLTIFVVAKGDTLQDWRSILSKRGEDNVGWQFRKDNTDFATFTVRGTSGNDGERGSTLINGVPHVWSMRKTSLKRTQWADGNLEYHIDDRGSIPDTNSDVVIAGRDQDGITSLSGVEIGEILVYDQALSDSDVSKMEGHLAHKWGLLANMPGVHSYKSETPQFENRPEILLSDRYSIKKDSNLSMPMQVNRVASNFLASGLPIGLDINSTTGLIYGVPSVAGSFTARVEASNQSGTFSKDILFTVTDFSDWKYSSSISFPGYTGSSLLNDFPVYLELNSSLSGFSYDQFASPFGYDLRFLGNNGSEELYYEPVIWNKQGTSGFWVLLSAFDENSTVQAIWGNPNATQQPSYCNNGIVWSNYNGVWHMDGTGLSTVKESRASAHATPYNFETLRVPGVVGTALSFDGVNDYVELPLSIHPQSDARQLTLSFWSYGGSNLSSSSSTTLLESGSAQGRSLNIHFPNASRLHWDAGGQNSYDNTNREFSSYSGQWDHWAFQKDIDEGVMYVYRNGQLWLDGYNRSRPFDGDVESFRLGSNRYGGWYWNGLLDELRISFSIESPDSILASYESQRPGGNFSAMQPVIGPPLLINGQVAEGYANDSNLSYLIQVFPSATTFSAVGLPAGILLNSSTGELSGVPLQGGTYNITVTASNSSGKDQGILTLSIVERTGFTHQVDFNCSAYSGTTLQDFPLLIRLDRSVTNFSLKSFASNNCNDLRFYDQHARELEYEIDEINDANGSLSVWVKAKELNSSTFISAYWGNPTLAQFPPVYSGDGSTWTNGFRGVWHMRSFEGIEVLTDSSVYRNHAYDDYGIGDTGIVGSGRTLSGGVEKFLRVPSAFSLDDLHEKSFTFSTWIKLDEAPPSKAEDSVYASGYLTNPNDTYFDDINNFYTLTPSGSRIMQTGPRQGLYFDGDNDFKNGGIGINRNDNYLTFFQAIFTPQESGDYFFRCDRKDDYSTIWLDLDRDGTFEKNGDLGGEKLGGNGNFTSTAYPLISGSDYKIAIAHGEGRGGSRIRPWIKTPSEDWQIIDPSNPTQTGMFSVTFDGNFTNDISPYIIAKHGVGERISLSGGKTAVFHDLVVQGEISAISPSSLYSLNSAWKHVTVSVDHLLGDIKIYEDGNLTISSTFTAGESAHAISGQDWYFGQGLVPSSFDEMRLANVARSADWVQASYLNQNPTSTLPVISAVSGLPSFRSLSTFNLPADQPFNHSISVTGSPLVFTAVGLPSGILLSSNDGNLSGSPSVSGQFTSTISALYPNGNRADQQYRFTISPSAPDIIISIPQVVNSTSLSIPYEMNATGGEDPMLYVVADTIDHGTNFYAWSYRKSLGNKGLGSGTAILGGLEPNQSYYVRLYAENSAGYDWTGKEFLIRTQPNKEHLPTSLAMWLDAADLAGNGSNTVEGFTVSTWNDKSGKDRDMANPVGNPTIKLEGHGGKPVVDFDGKSQNANDYNFSGTDLNLWRNGGYSVFGVSRYTGGDNERVISSSGHNWLLGHHGNQIGRYFFNGWVDQGFASDTNFHIFETLHEGRTVNTNPSASVWTDGIEGSYRSGGKQGSSNWNFYPGQLSFGAFDNLREASKCQVAEFIMLEGLINEQDRLKIEGYLSHKWGIPLPSSHPWANDAPTYGDVILSGSTALIDTNRTVVPTIINRSPANLKNTSASLTGRLVDTGLGILPINPAGVVSTSTSTIAGLSPPIIGDINASNISQSSANLRGTLISTGGETPIITIVWGDEDHGSDFNNLSNWDFNESLGYSTAGPFSVLVGDLQERTVYFFRVAVSNSIGSFMSPDVGVFVTSSVDLVPPQSILWLDANDSSASTGTWLDTSGNGNHATKQGNPSVVSNAQNGLSVMRYTGTNGEYHSFANFTDVRTVFWVFKNSGGYWPLLGDNNRYHFHPMNSNDLVNGRHTSGSVKNGNFALNGTPASWDTSKPSTMSILSLRTLGNVEASNFASDRNINGRFGNVDLAELIIFDIPLSDDQIKYQEGYLAKKWGLQSKLPSSHPHEQYFMSETPQITSPNSDSLTIGQAYNFQASTNISDSTFSAYNLPDGLTCSPSGLITGTPTIGGIYKASLTAKNSTYTCLGFLTLTIPDTAPGIIARTAGSISSTTANLIGDINHTGGRDSIVTVYWGDNDAGTGNWDQNISLGSQGKGSVSHFVDGLSPSTIYHYRFSGTNFNGATGGVSWSNTETFTTDSNISVPILSSIYSVSDTNLVGAKLNAVLLNNGGDSNTSVTFYWGESDGGTNPLAWQQSIEINQAEVGSVTGHINSGLGFPREYYMRVKASNVFGSTWTPTSLSFLPQAGNSGFTPMDYSGLRLWLDGSDLNGTGQTLVLNPGESVGLIKDKSGQGRDAAQTTPTFQPTFVHGALNGLPNLRFDGTNDYLTFEKIETIRTVFLVLNRKTGNQGFLLGDDTGHHFHSASNAIWSSTWTHPNVINGLTQINGNLRDGLTSTYDFNTPTLISIRTNGAVRASNFSKDRNNEIYWKGDLAELLVYNESLPTSVLRKVEGYLAHKWGIQSSLVGSHPYRITAPSRSKSAAVTKIYWGGTDGGVDPSLWDNVIDVGEVGVGLRKLSDDVAVLAEPLPNQSGASYGVDRLVDGVLPMDGWRSTWTAWFKEDPQLTFNLGAERSMNKIRIYFQPYERADELKEVEIWVADEEMSFSLLKTVPGVVGIREQGVFAEYDLEGITTRAIRLAPKFQGWGHQWGEVEFWVYDSGDFEAKVEGLTKGQTYYYRTFTTNDGGSQWAPDTNSFQAEDKVAYESGKLIINTTLGTWKHSGGDQRSGVVSQKKLSDNIGNEYLYKVCRFEFDEIELKGSLEVEVKGSASLEIVARNGDAFIGVPIAVSGEDGSTSDIGSSGPGGFNGGEVGGRGFGPGGGLGGNAPGGGGFGGAGGLATATTGQPYATGGLLDFVGGSGGGGFLVDYTGGGGGGALKIESSQTLTLDSRLFAMGGSGISGSGGGSGGSLYLKAENLVLTAQSIIDVSGGSNGGGAGRIYLEGTKSLLNQGSDNLRKSGGPGAAPGTEGTLRFVRPSHLEELDFRVGSIVIDTDVGSLTHSDGSIAYGLTEDYLYIDQSGAAWPYSVCRFRFTRIQLGGGVVVQLKGRNALALEAYSGDLILGANIRADGGNAVANLGGTGILGGYSGVDGASLYGSGPGAPKLSSSVGHGAAYGGHGSGNAGIYGDRSLDALLGGSSGGASDTAGSGAGGGSILLKASRELKIEPNVLITANGGNGSGNGASGSGGGVRLEATRVYNQGRIEAKAGNGVQVDGDNQSRGSSGGRVSIIATAEVTAGDIDVSGEWLSNEGSIFIGGSYQNSSLIAENAKVTIDTKTGYFSIEGGAHGEGVFSDHSYTDSLGLNWNYGVSTFTFAQVRLSGDTNILLRGDRSLSVKTVAGGEIYIGSDLLLDGGECLEYDWVRWSTSFKSLGGEQFAKNFR